ncbi:DUF2254 domain-containing protein [Rhodobacterales bacterium]|nr:DUF2254 domain-containing protein [Rhodobacterales bacterium]
MDLAYHTSARALALVKLTKGFLFIPVCIALTGAALAFGTVLIDNAGWLSGLFDALGYGHITADGARSVLSTIAGAMMSVLSLVYSLTLVVFTLAAGNISARLLETFSNNRTTQMTIGLLGATFLYALITLFVVDESHEMRFSVVTSIILAAISVFWLVYFVNDVAGRIRVDAEIGRIQHSLRRSIDQLLAKEPRQRSNERDELPDMPAISVLSKRSGYVTSIDSEALMTTARDVNGFVDVLLTPGAFVIEGMPIAEVRTRTERKDFSEVPHAFSLGKARAPEGDIQFAVHLMVEIALRALSPGINDSYTAISAIDHLSASFAVILQRGAPSSLLLDEDNTPRLWLDLIDVDEVLTTAIRPLRQASMNNVLVLDHLIQALERMTIVCREEHLHLITQQLRSIASDAAQFVDSREDRSQIARRIWSARQRIGKNEKSR